MEITFIIDIALYALILIVVYLLLAKNFVRAKMGGFLIPIYFLKVISVYFDLIVASSLADVFLIIIFITVVVLNEEKVKSILRRKRTIKKLIGASESEQKAFYETIDNAVRVLSTTKTGAIITFEKNNSLEEYIKAGVSIDAPVSSELLTSIFHFGTALHDGAVIVRDNIIEAASVYYTPTTKALKGRFGARHRASIGISEVSDSITVVISEETGRISIAMDGELISVSREGFMQTFKDYMEREV